MKKIFTLFRGFNGVGMGAETAGLKDIGGIEYDPNIAGVCDLNFPESPTIIADIRDVDPSLLFCEKPDYVHASPSCKNASIANQIKNEDGTKETDFDRECGQATCRFIKAWKPSCFTLENVWAYRNFDSFNCILRTLIDNGYSLDYWHLNAADYGVPQSRKRLILIAKHGEHKVLKPQTTHIDPSKVSQGQMDMFANVTPVWNSWYESIEDLLLGLPDSQFADWQLTRLPEELKTMLVAQGKYGDNLVTANDKEPSFTVTANSNQTGVRAFLIPGDNTSNTTIRYGDEPMVTINTNTPGKCPHKAFIVDCQNAGDTKRGERSLTIRRKNEPMFTLTSSMGIKRPTRACVEHGRVVAMSTRCLARFQSFSDSYILPDSKTLASKGLGNAVPPLLYQKIISGLMAEL